MSGPVRLRRSMVLSGGPGVGKSTCAQALARTRPRAAVVEVDDLRQLVVTGAAAPWEGAEGELQAALGAENACGVAQNLLTSGFEVVITDVVTPATTEVYRRGLPEALVVHLQLDLAEAQLRAATRTVYLSEEEFAWLHRRDGAEPPAADAVLQVRGLTVADQVARLERLWLAAG